jgi:hypothetical protein
MIRQFALVLAWPLRVPHAYHCTFHAGMVGTVVVQ